MNTKPTIRNFLIVILPAVVVVFVIFFLIMPKVRQNRQINENNIPVAQMITNFTECVASGNPVLESYPRQCHSGGQTFTEDIGTELAKTDLIQVDFPRPNQVINSPLTITGQARGNWFFEASFPVVLTNWDGLIIAQGIATAQSDWMTLEFVPFTATLTFTPDSNAYSNKGALILQKENPSGLSQNDDALEIPVILGTAESVGNTGILPFKSGISGIVLLGPTCPVMREGDTTCADKPYQTIVNVYDKKSAKSTPFATTKTDKDGKFTFTLRPGEYTVEAVGGNPLPRCESKDVIIAGEVMSIVDISCDSGIR